MVLSGRRVALGVGGGIAAIRAGDVARELRRRGAEVRVAMTAAAQAFVTPLTLQSLSGNSVLSDPFDAKEEQFGHLHLARWAEVFVVVPATADVLARIRAGMGNDSLTTSLLAFRGPVVLAPAMNTAMWEQELVQANVESLRQLSRFRFAGPVSGPLADGDVGMGRLAEVPAIVEVVAECFTSRALAGQRVLVTAGPTREYADPVRFISSPSTGKMGLAVAEAAVAAGAQVTVVVGPTSESMPAGVEVVRVVTAEEMQRAVLARVTAVEVLVAAAAVSDWRPANPERLKEKKGVGPVSLELVRTPDVLGSASELVHQQPSRPLLVGFAAETHDVLAYARSKRLKKRLDAIVANDVSQPAAGFGVDSNVVTIIAPDGSERLHSGTKRHVATALVSAIADWLATKNGSP